jgi:pectate lyase
LWRWFAPLAVVAIAVPAAVMVPTNAHAVTIDPNAWYEIVSRHSGKAIDICGQSSDDGACVQQYGRGGQANQQFRFVDSGGGYYRLQARHSGKVIGVAASSTENGARLIQWYDDGSTNQQWQASAATDSGYVKMINRNSGKALDVWEWSTADGGRISQYDDTGGWNQQWQLINVGGGPGGGPYSNVPDGFAQGTTGGAGGQTVTVTNQSQLNQYVTASAPYVIRVSGSINISPRGTELRVASHKTIVGVGTSGEIVGGGFFLNGVSNVIIRNLTIRDTLMPDDDPGDDAYDYDAIQIDTGSNIWIDHNRLTRMNDGLLDSRRDTTNITVSWNQFLQNNKTFGIGWTDNVTARMTIHHNWFRDTNSRNPSADNLANLHMYNNYLQNVSGYGNFVRGATKGVIENSYYQNVTDPYYVEETGELVQRGNITVDSSWRSGRIRERGSAFNPGSFYSYTLHPAADVPGLVQTYSGPQATIGG